LSLHNDNDVSYNRGNCIQGKNGTYVNGTIDEKSFGYNSNTGTLSFNYTNSDTGAIGKGVIGNVHRSGGVSSGDLLGAAAAQHAAAIFGPWFGRLAVRNFRDARVKVSEGQSRK
jgi:hypothetical protein